MKKQLLTFINSKLISKSELARQLGISYDLFYKKLNHINYNKFSVNQMNELEKIRKDFCK